MITQLCWTHSDAHTHLECFRRLLLVAAGPQQGLEVSAPYRLLGVNVMMSPSESRRKPSADWRARCGAGRPAAGVHSEPGGHWLPPPSAPRGGKGCGLARAVHARLHLGRGDCSTPRIAPAVSLPSFPASHHTPGPCLTSRLCLPNCSPCFHLCSFVPSLFFPPLGPSQFPTLTLSAHLSSCARTRHSNPHETPT